MLVWWVTCSGLFVGHTKVLYAGLVGNVAPLIYLPVKLICRSCQGSVCRLGGECGAFYVHLLAQESLVGPSV